MAIFKVILLCIPHCVGTLFISCLDLTERLAFGTPYWKIVCPFPPLLLLLPIQNLASGVLTSSADAFKNGFDYSIQVLSDYFSKLSRHLT
jgi:hypothetical protein